MSTQLPDTTPPDGPGGAAAIEPTFERRVRSKRRLRAEHIRDYGIIVFVVAIFVYFSFASPVFLTVDNLLNIVYAQTSVGIVACAVTLAIIAGNFDLSLGAILALSEVLGAWVAIHWGVGWFFPV